MQTIFLLPALITWRLCWSVGVDLSQYRSSTVHHPAGSELRQEFGMENAKPFIRDPIWYIKPPSKSPQNDIWINYKPNGKQSILRFLILGERTGTVCRTTFTIPRSQMISVQSEIRSAIYTTRVIEGFHRQRRAATKTKGSFISAEALMKRPFPAPDDIWSKGIDLLTTGTRHWGSTFDSFRRSS